MWRSIRPPHRRGERHHRHDGVCVHAGVRPGWTIGQRGSGAARDRRSSGRPASRSARGGRPVRTGRSESAIRDQPLWGAGDDAGGVCVVSPGDPRRRQRHRGAAAWTIRFGQADRPRHQSLVGQAGAWRVAHDRRWVVEAMAGVWVFSDSTDFLEEHAAAGLDCRDAGPRDLQVQAPTMWLAANANYYTGRANDDRRQAEPRPAAQLTHRRHVFVSA